MFGGYGISVEGLTLAILADLGQGERLWLKADAQTRSVFEAAGCQRFTYLAKGKARSMGYYSAPDDAMESARDMTPWALLALQAALAARQRTGKGRATRNVNPRSPDARDSFRYSSAVTD